MSIEEWKVFVDKRKTENFQVRKFIDKCFLYIYNLNTML